MCFKQENNWHFFFFLLHILSASLGLMPHYDLHVIIIQIWIKWIFISNIRKVVRVIHSSKFLPTFLQLPVLRQRRVTKLNDDRYFLTNKYFKWTYNKVLTKGTLLSSDSGGRRYCYWWARYSRIRRFNFFQIHRSTQFFLIPILGFHSFQGNAQNLT